MYNYRPDPEDLDRYPNYSPLGTAVDRILYNNDYRPVTDPEEALAIITGAAAGRTPDLIRALHAVGGPIRRLRRKARTLPREDFDSAVTTALAEALKAFNPETDAPSFSYIGKVVYSRGTELVIESRSRVVEVPLSTRRRYFRILDAARKQVGDDAEAHEITFAALELAPKFHMQVRTFLAVRDAVEAVPFTAVPTPEQDEAGMRLEDVLDEVSLTIAPELSESTVDLFDIAMSVLTPEETEVIAIAYGLYKVCPVAKADEEPRPDAEVAHRLALSRSRAQQIRTGALDKMRATLLGEL